MINFLILQVLLNTSIIYFFEKISKIVNLYDIPDGKRKIHKKKIPLLGGSLFLLNILLFIFYYLINKNEFNFSYFLTNKEIILFCLFTFFFFLLGFIDDKFNLSANIKLITKFILIFSLFIFEDNIVIRELKFSFLHKNISIDYISYFFSILCFLLFINAFNMFDGINLQSALYSSFIFLIFLQKGIFIEISLVLLVVLLFFIYLNFKNKSFMGDNGTLLISFILSYLFVKSNVDNIFTADEIFLIMLIPGLDLIRLAVTRVMSRKHPFSADTNHIHHILSKNIGVNKCLLMLFLLIAIPNILSIFFGGTLYLIIISICIYFLIIFFFNSYQKKK